ncbi:beta-glucosidase BglX [Pseudomonas sp. SDO528_S397]
MRQALAALFFLLVITGAPAAPRDAAEREVFLRALVARMTPEEKAGQLRLVSHEATQTERLEQVANGQVGGLFGMATLPELRALQDAAVQRSRLGIPLFFGFDSVHGHRTIFPIGLALASSWDPHAVALSARITALEASADGLNMTFAPMVDISRDARWGRVSEGLGEDTYLASRMAAVMVRAFQGQDPCARGNLMAAAKHFALYGAAEGGRDYNAVDMSLRQMHQQYFGPYQAAIQAGAGAMMVTLGSVNGVPATANRWLLHEVLREQMGFGGLVLSDHGAVQQLIAHGVAGNAAEAAQQALQAGVEMSMNDTFYAQALPALIRSGAIAGPVIDQAVHDVLAAKYAMGLFDDPYRRLGNAAQGPVEHRRLHRAYARDVARKTLVLLKNRAATLPLARSATLAVIGPLAKSRLDILGSWSALGDPHQAVSVYDGLQQVAGPRLLYARGANVTQDPDVISYLGDDEIEFDPRPVAQMIDEAVQVARQADVIIAVVGEARSMSHEAASRTRLDLPGHQGELIRALKTTGKPLVLVLMNGRPLAIGEQVEQADAVLETWYAGTEGGNAIADVLWGDYNPSGKLAMTFPRSVGQVPVYYSVLNTGRPYIPGEPRNYTSQYFDEPVGPLFAFGHGLSYTRFGLSTVRLSSKIMPRNGQITAQVTLTNTGARRGETVVQLYIRDVVASVSRPVKELKGFEKVMLEASERKVITFALGEHDLKFYNAHLQYAAEPGTFEVQIGLDSVNVETQRFELR